MTPPPAQPNPREILVVREGSHRITWRRLDAALWQPDAVWPTPDQAHQIELHLDRGGRVLVLLDPDLAVEDGAARVPVMREELLTAPTAVKALAEDDDPVLTHLTVRLLDWLPAHLQAAGLNVIPRLLGEQAPSGQPAISGERCDRTHDQVRYARLTRPRTPSGEELDALARLAFPVNAAQSAGTTLNLRDLSRSGGRTDRTRQPVYAA
jgi:hypothetical protein